MTALSLVIPTFNEQDNVEALVSQLEVALGALDAELIFVDDSTDDTPQRIRDVAGATTLPIRLLHRDVPIGGLSGAVVAGLRAATGTWAVVMDGDLQHPPTVVPELVRAQSDCDVVVASRYVPGGGAGGLSSALRHGISRGSTVLVRALFPRRLRECTDPMSGFYAVRLAALDLDALRPQGYKILLETLVRTPLRVREVPFTFGSRVAGQSKAGVREGMAFLRQLLALRVPAPVVFALVGASGIVPNLAVVAALPQLGVSVVVASAVAIQVALAWNFVGTELLVFRDRRVGQLWHRAARFWAVGNVDLLRLPFVALLVHAIGMGGVSANAITLAAAFLIRYQLTSRLVYRHAPLEPVAAVSASATAALAPESAVEWKEPSGAVTRVATW